MRKIQVVAVVLAVLAGVVAFNPNGHACGAEKKAGETASSVVE